MYSVARVRLLTEPRELAAERGRRSAVVNDLSIGEESEQRSEDHGDIR